MANQKKSAVMLLAMFIGYSPLGRLTTKFGDVFLQSRAASVRDTDREGNRADAARLSVANSAIEK